MGGGSRVQRLVSPCPPLSTGEAKVRFDRINLINGTMAGAILAVGMIEKEGGLNDKDTNWSAKIQREDEQAI